VAGGGELAGSGAMAPANSAAHQPRTSVRGSDSGIAPLRTSVRSTVSTTNRQRALQSPLVRAVMEKTGGRIVDIHPTPHSTAETNNAPADENAAGAVSARDVSTVDE